MSSIPRFYTYNAPTKEMPASRRNYSTASQSRMSRKWWEKLKIRLKLLLHTNRDGHIYVLSYLHCMCAASNGLVTGGIHRTLKGCGQSNNVCDNRDLEARVRQVEGSDIWPGILTIWKPCSAYFFADSPDVQ